MNESDQQHEWPFRRRIELRQRLWWKESTPGTHGLSECKRRRNHDDPEESWKCCRFWQRKFCNKWNSRQFAIRLGMRVPDLYWAGDDVRSLPLETLPGSYVIRFCSGHSSRQVWAMDGDHELLRDMHFNIESLREDLISAASAYAYRISVMVEERLRRSDGQPGLLNDCGFHAFGDEIAFVAARLGMKQYAYYRPDWRPVPFRVNRMQSPETVQFAKPRHLDEMLVWARRFGNAFGSYVRVDVYDTDKGAVFGELAPAPCGGKCYTLEADKILNDCWERQFPGKI